MNLINEETEFSPKNRKMTLKNQNFMFNIFTILSILVSVNTYLHDPPLDGIDYWASRFFIYSRFLHKFIINFSKKNI